MPTPATRETMTDNTPDIRAAWKVIRDCIKQARIEWGDNCNCGHCAGIRRAIATLDAALGKDAAQ